MAPVARKKGKGGQSADDAPDNGAAAKKNGKSSGAAGLSPSAARAAVFLLVLVAAAVVCWRLLGSGGGSSADEGHPKATARKTAATVWADAGAPISGEYLLGNVSCVRRPAQGACGEPRRSDRCARFVLDSAVPEEEALELRRLVEWLVKEAWGGGSGPPSVVDLHQGSISYKEQFVELAALMEFKSLTFDEAQKQVYHSVRRTLRTRVSRLFGVPEEALLHDLTFFSHINGSKVAKTMHDEYWHQHTDTEQYGTFEYTAMLYLSTSGEDFDGGEFVFDPPAGSSDAGRADAAIAVEPRFNRLVAFSSDAENPHRVEQVSRGVRIALTAAFTCDPEKAASIGEAFPPKRPDDEEGAEEQR